MILVGEAGVVFLFLEELVWIAISFVVVVAAVVSVVDSAVVSLDVSLGFFSFIVLVDVFFFLLT